MWADRQRGAELHGEAADPDRAQQGAPGGGAGEGGRPAARHQHAGDGELNYQQYM